MLMHSKAGFLLFTFVASGFVFSPIAAQASNITLQGSFTHDDDVQLFDLTLAAAATVDIRSYGYAGGTTSTGTVAPSGGFDSILTLFEASGAFLTDNDDGAGVATDPTTGLAADARITASLIPGSYIVALTEFDNFSLGNLSDGFAEAGKPNFTANPSFATGGACPSNMFRDISGTAGRCRDGSWAVDFVNVASITPVAPVPEPGTAVLLGAGLIGLAFLRKKGRAGVLLVLLTGVFNAGAKAQSTGQDPDYTNVTDILNGKRTLLRVQDIVVGMYNPTTPGPGILHSWIAGTGVINSANGVSTTGQVQQSNISMTDDRIAQPFAGRVYQSDHDQVLTVVPTSNAPYLLMTDGNNTTDLPTFPSVKSGSNYTTFSAVMADFNGDGYADLAINFGPGDETGDMVIFSGAAKDGTFSAHYGPVHGLDDPNGSQQETLLAMTAGDFYGDGRKEIAGLAYKRSGVFVLCIYAVDPATLAITKVSEITPDYSAEGAFSAVQFYSLTAGKLTGQTTNQQLVYAYATGTSKDTKIAVFDFSSSGNSLSMKELTIFDAGSQPNALGDIIQVQAARFDPNSSYDLIAFMFAWQNVTRPYGSGTKYIRTLSFDPQSNSLSANPLTDFSNATWVSRMTIGNFDKKTTVNGTTQPDFGLQISFATSGGHSGDPAGLAILGTSADGKSYTPDQENYTIPSNISSLGFLYFVTAGDMQGRSYVLGEPTKITVQNLTQPTVIAAAPPMHIDWVKPLDGKPDEQIAQVLNLTAVPGSYYTQYQTAVTNNDQSSDTGTTSHGWSVKESASLKTQFGKPKTDPVSASTDVGFAASQANQQIDANGTNNFSSHSFDVSVRTNFADQVWYTESYFNLWIYPVLGKTTCPASQPADCPPSEQVPLNLQFSAPDHLQPLDVESGDLLPWYQPPWEYGNVLSYPANYTQLQLEIPVTLDKLSQDTAFHTDGLVETVKADWAGGSGTNHMNSSTRTYTEEGSLTVTGKVNFPEGSAELKGNVTAGGSQSFGNLHTSQDTLGASTGVGINKPGSFANPGLYSYTVVPYILGQKRPDQDANDIRKPPDLSTYGTIRTVFTVDPTVGAGPWWQETYGQRPDVALNHPIRWLVTKQNLAAPVPRNCRPLGGDANTMNCASESANQPSDPWSSEFHWMRGFFITDATNAGQGPQMSIANAGDQLSLQTRVYNYSLKAMDPGTTVQVRFYVQPWNSGSSVANGPSVRIDEKSLPPIPPFDSADGAPLNWVLAGTTFDTTPYAGQDLVFWVVVWMQDANGQLVPEIEGHGLTSIPGPQITSLAEINEETYSNNVGFYNSVLHVLSPPALGAEPGPTTTEVEIDKVDVSGQAAMPPGPAVKVSAMLRAGSKDASGLTVWFYDGDPNSGGTVFNGERVPYIPANRTFRVLALYHAPSCGTHELFLVVNRGTRNEIVRRADPVRVACNAF
jgi:hypothetical protein